MIGQGARQRGESPNPRTFAALPGSGWRLRR